MCGMRQTAAMTAPMPGARPRCRGQAPEPRSGAPKAQGLMAAIAVAAQSNLPSIVQQITNSIGATAPIDASLIIQIYTSLTDMTQASNTGVNFARRSRVNIQRRLTAF